MKITKEQERKIDEVLTILGKRCKQNINGGRVFKEELKTMVALARESIKMILEDVKNG